MEILKKPLRQMAKEITKVINEGSYKNEDRLGVLNTLISTGKTSSEQVELLNQILIEDLSELIEFSKIKVILVDNSLEIEELADSLVSHYKNIDKEFLSDSDEDQALKAKFLEVIKLGLEKILLSKNSVKISTEENKDFPRGIVFEYISNYFNNSRKFTEDSLIKYLNYLEAQINTEEEELYLEDTIKDLIKNKINQFLLEIEENLVSKEDFKRCGFMLKKEFLWTSARDYERPIKKFKDEVQRKTFDIAVSANKEVFPSLLEEKIEEASENYEELFISLTKILKDLESERRELMETISHQSLDDFYGYAETQNSIDTVNNYESAVKAHSLLGIDGGGVLKGFLAKRNNLAPVIKNQIQGKKSYKAVKDEIDQLKLEELFNKESGKTVIIYFINAVSLFFDELESTVLGDLDITFDDLWDHNEIEAVCKDARSQISQTMKEVIYARSLEDSKSISLHSYVIPRKISEAIVSQITIEDLVSVEALTNKIRYELSKRNKKDLLMGNSVSAEDIYKAIEMSKEKSFLAIDSIKEIVENEEIKKVLYSIPLIGEVSSVSMSLYSLGKLFFDSKEKSYKKRRELESYLIEIVEFISTDIVKNFFK